ncbi:hypothetical protein Pint_06911 [Pistacia integerrima]|uniref:Uncharacterized protein n=1 Tax=Pistacia integerrima TaxID=434235 RepID=A0ACC0XYF6_9ROSI|nr:hypothetical protein Pint_06911 [Pistacia integerrima]
MMTLLATGTDTTSVTAEWAMSLLLNHPLVLKRARAELDCHVGHDHLAEEPDLVKLPYLQHIINETFWLFLVAPLLVPHESSNYCTIGGYDIPPSTMLIVNAWSIHRYPKVWEDLESSRPERFEGLEGEVEAYNFIPFGRGRRSCPGAGLANRVLIGCDGANSVVGDFLELKPKKLHSSCAVRGFTYFPNGHGFAHELVRTRRDNTLFGMAPVTDNLACWFVVHQWLLQGTHIYD